MEDQFIKEAGVLLLDAVKYDTAKDNLRAITKYTDGCAKLMEALKYIGRDDAKRKLLFEKIDNYMTRAETLKVNKPVKVAYMETRRIEENSTGHGYDRIFSKVLDERLTSVHVQDAYITQHHQMQNFVRFCELLVTKAPKLKIVSLTTSEDGRQNAENLKDLALSLQDRKITLTINYQKNLHDREIRFDNGWMVKIGRGLDYFKPTKKYALGSLEMNLRPCKECTVDVFKME